MLLRPKFAGRPSLTGFVVLFLVFLSISEPLRGEPSAQTDSVPGADSATAADSIAEAVRGIYSGRHSAQEQQAAIETIVNALEDGYDANLLAALRKALRKDPHALDAALPRMADWIPAWLAYGELPERRLCNLLDLLIEIETVPPELDQELAKIVQAEDKYLFASSQAAAILFRRDPENNKPRQWLHEKLASESSVSRLNAAYSLGNIRLAAKPFVKELTKLLQDEDVAVRVMAARALWRIDPDSNNLVPIVQQSLREPYASVPIRPRTISESGVDGHYNLAVGLLAEMGPAAASAVNDIAGKLTDEDVVLRAFSALALAEIGVASPEVVQALERGTQDKNAWVAATAQEALRKLKSSK